ncbi:MAG TPA: alkene reductase, partial [Bryobacteraceae bacterium]|nr:alkene reductase [Bryobacteraceae bacterium]
VMAPLTRQRAGTPPHVPNDLMTEYYRQRASAGGLIGTEATQIALAARGYPDTPGIHTDEQVAGWKQITNAVHEKNGLIVLQLWHTGRISHSSFQPDGSVPAAPSAVRPSGKTYTADFKLVDFETPRALDGSELAGIVQQFADAASRARAAGFDGVEIHGANGYLLDQFLLDGTNRRTDEYGGSIENRARFVLEVAEAVAAAWEPGRVGIRFSPWGSFNDMFDSDPVPLFRYVLRQLSPLGLAYVHLIEPRHQELSPDGVDVPAPSASQLFRQDFSGALISAGNYNGERAQAAVRNGLVDAVAFGRYFIANPDLPARLQRNAPLNPYDRSTFYGGDARGYTDYPTLVENFAQATA